jgi:hypothetical protein
MALPQDFPLHFLHPGLIAVFPAENTVEEAFG